jgi:hypothetical protein
MSRSRATAAAARKRQRTDPADVVEYASALAILFAALARELNYLVINHRRRMELGAILRDELRLWNGISRAVLSIDDYRMYGRLIASIRRKRSPRARRRR